MQIINSLKLIVYGYLFFMCVNMLNAFVSYYIRRNMNFNSQILIILSRITDTFKCKCTQIEKNIRKHL